jgi:hypothetical protein
MKKDLQPLDAMSNGQQERAASLSLLRRTKSVMKKKKLRAKKLKRQSKQE